LKNIIVLLLFIGSSFKLYAQNDSSNNNVNFFLTIPAFKLLSVPDSLEFTNQYLKKNSPVVILFFSPDCDHCQIETKELLAYKQELKHIQILMVSNAPYPEIKDFYETYDLSSMSNIKVARDINLKLGLVYKIRTYPSLFVYDQKGNLAKAFVGNIGVPAILEAVK